MEKKQWYAFSIGLILLGLFFRMLSTDICSMTDLGCIFRRYMMGVPGLTLFGVGLICMVCGAIQR